MALDKQQDKKRFYTRKYQDHMGGHRTEQHARLFSKKEISNSQCKFYSHKEKILNCMD